MQSIETIQYHDDRLMVPLGGGLTRYPDDWPGKGGVWSEMDSKHAVEMCEANGIKILFTKYLWDQVSGVGGLGS